ncbi:hypothetical protein C9418_23210 [Rhizobium sp. SEMIA 4032]|uniref:Uncharacterized protein n=1 Tax=Agrobacterium deltaense Zutra 3/1 TaxID=1183427 RepID=A0A1S7RPQ9_9HYPH|nr:hypothetical protein C9418_23210 [Rhizobium sp. SEMIA 4032]CUX55664.1 hypothetical protein AGR7C_Lc210009 [Agrobacterium deltaense Zutra 3/1]
MRMPNVPKGVRVAIDDMQNMGMTVIKDKSFTRGINACGRPGLFARGRPYNSESAARQRPR